MSFQSKDFRMAKAPGSLGDGEVTYNNPTRNEPKRSHQWFVDGNEAELFSNKKQAIEVPNLNSFTGLLNSTISPWGNASGFHSVAGQFPERLFDNETAKTTNFDDRNLLSTSVGNMSMGRKVIEDPFGIDATFGLSISHPLEDPKSGISYGGIRKVKVSQVKDAESFVPVSLGHVYSTGDDTTMSNDHAYGKADVDSVTMGLSFDRGNDSMISMADPINREDTNFISMGQSYNKGVPGDISMGQPYNKGDTSEMSMDLVYRENDGSTSISKDESSITTMTQSFTREDGNSIAMCVFNGHNNAVSMDQVFSKDDSNVILPIKTFNEGVCNTISINPSGRVDDNGILMGKTDSSDLSMVQSFSKGGSNIISFGGLNDDEDNLNPSSRLVCSYDFLMGQPSLQRSEELSEKVLPVFTSDALSSGVQVIAPGDTVSKRKQEQKASKKAPPNNFPSNVRSLLSTGMLDGIAVKYVAWSREKELHGVIKGSAYLCGCQSCNFSKAINAYEFERHAGCKTKHPNNHIYFENGKTIYGIVQELRNTPQNLLFEVIQTITGSPINQKSFRLWKESFLAAARELQRIYGKEDGKILS